MMSFLDGFIGSSNDISCPHTAVCTIDLYGKEFGVHVASCVNPKWGPWEDIVGEFKV